MADPRVVTCPSQGLPAAQGWKRLGSLFLWREKDWGAGPPVPRSCKSPIPPAPQEGGQGQPCSGEHPARKQMAPQTEPVRQRF